MNKCIFHGRLTADPKTFYLEDENITTISHFSIAIEDREYKLPDGKYKVDYIPVKALGKLGEICEKHLFKGTEVVVSGKLQSGSYEDKKNGKKNYTLELLTENLDFCGSAKKEKSAGDSFMNIPEGNEELPFK